MTSGGSGVNNGFSVVVVVVVVVVDSVINER